jgi:hypothetical protein
VKPGKNIINELREIAPALATLDRMNFYEVQEGYFAGWGMQIIKLVQRPEKEEILPAVLALVPKTNLYPAPGAAYFESFSAKVVAAINKEEVAEELSYAIPLLQQVAKKKMYAVPAGYFGAFPAAMVKLAAKRPVQGQAQHWGGIWSRLWEALSLTVSRPRYSFAMASAVGMIVCVGLVMNTRNGAMSDEDRIFGQMQQLSDADLHQYVAKHRDEFDERMLLNNINNVDFTHYFDKPEQVTPHIESHTKVNLSDEAAADDIVN